MQILDILGISDFPVAAYYRLAQACIEIIARSGIIQEREKTFLEDSLEFIPTKYGEWRVRTTSIMVN